MVVIEILKDCQNKTIHKAAIYDMVKTLFLNKYTF